MRKKSVAVTQSGGESSGAVAVLLPLTHTLPRYHHTLPPVSDVCYADQTAWSDRVVPHDDL